MKRLLFAVAAATLAAVCITIEGGPGSNLAAARSGKTKAKGNRNKKDAVKKAIAYGESVIGAPYIWWKGGPLPKKAPMWTENGAPPDPEVVRKEGTNCAGLTNLMLRSIGKQIPFVKGHGRGGTDAYAKYYEKVAKKFHVNRKYPAGTLIARGYRSVKSQGHVAVVLADGHVLQSIPDEGVNKTYTVKQSDGNGYYEYAVLPKDWLGEDGD